MMAFSNEVRPLRRRLAAARLALRTRRDFLAAGAAGLGLAACSRAAERPNILCLTCEDLSPVLGCYGDAYAYTPNLDRLAAEGVRFTNAFATAPVCTPARSCLITGIHAVSLGTQNLRCETPLSAVVRCHTEFLREAGYYCTNNVKEDYNFRTPAAAWDESSGKAHWRNGPKNRPFFSIFNFMTTHQSQVRYPPEELEKVSATLAPEERHDPARAPLPPYYPDTPVVRSNVAALYTQVTRMDKQVGDVLRQLDEDGRREDTIVIFYSDHGTGLPRGKRWLHDSGIRVPLIIRFPERHQRLAPSAPGTVSDRLVSFVDFPPTLLNLAGLPAPEYMQGRPFLGADAGEPNRYVFAARDRVDEVLETSRTVHDGRYQYIRNYLPHRPRMQRSDYSEITPIRKELRRLAREGKLSGDARWLMAPEKPPEELYDVSADPHEMRNLAASPEHAEVLDRMRGALREWVLMVRDTGFVPEADLAVRSGGGSPYDMARRGHDYPIERVLDAAECVGRGPGEIPKLRTALGDRDAAVRYWAATGLAALGTDARPAREELRGAAGDSSVAVRCAAAEALCRLGEEEKALPALIEALGHPDGRAALQAAIALASLGRTARPAIPALEAAVKRGGEPAEHFRYVEWALNAVRENAGG